MSALAVSGQAGGAHADQLISSDRGVVAGRAEPTPRASSTASSPATSTGSTPGGARFGALLTPQGKILFDFIVFEAPRRPAAATVSTCLKPFAPDLAKRLGFYKLRAKVTVEDLSDSARRASRAGATRRGRTSDGRARRATDPRLAGARLARRSSRPSERRRHALAATGTRPPTPTTPTASRSACRRAARTSSSATPSRTRR